jgi:6-phosphogluconolactonase
MTPLHGELLVHADRAALGREGAADLARLAAEAVATRGRFAVALTGGSSPGDLYRALAAAPFRDEIPWRDVHLFWGDDRVVPPQHPRSNFRLASRAFIDGVPIPAANVHRIRGELGLRRALEGYRAELHDFFDGRPRFDLIHLGLGEDGHVASLFPFDHANLLATRPDALPALHRQLGEWRVTLSAPVLNAARRVEFLLPDPARAPIARTAMSGPLDPLRIPAQGVRPESGDLIWRTTRAVVTAIRERREPA